MDIDKLKVLATAALPEKGGVIFDMCGPSELCALADYVADNPDELLELIESEREATELGDVLSKLLGQAAVILRGPEEQKRRHGFFDIPSRVKAVVQERDQLKAENDSLRQQLTDNELQARADAAFEEYSQEQSDTVTVGDFRFIL